MDKNTKIIISASDQTKQAIDSVKTNLGSLETKSNAVGLSLGRMLVPLGGAAGVVGVLGRMVGETIKASNEQAQLAAVLRSTGNAAGFTQDQLNRMAESLSGRSIFSAGDINNAQTRLLSYTGIVGKQFPEAMQVVIDMSARMGMSLEQSAETIGRALDVPSQGYQALTRQGFRFSDSQKELIKQLEETGRVSEAQDIIIQQLKSSYDGAAEAARNTLGGALSALRNQIDDLFQAGGSSVSSPLIVTLRDISALLDLVAGKGNMARDSVGWLLPSYREYAKAMGLDNGLPQYRPGDQLGGMIQDEQFNLGEWSAGRTQIGDTSGLNGTPKPAASTKASSQRSGKTLAEQAAETTAKLVREFQQATAPTQELSDRLQDQLNTYSDLDAGVRQYLQSLIDQTRQQEEAARVAAEWKTIADLQRASDQAALAELEAASAAEEARKDSLEKQAQSIREMLDPSIVLMNTISEIQMLASEGFIDADEETRAIQKVTDEFNRMGQKVRDNRSFMAELGVTFTSGFEDAFVSGAKLRDVLKGIEQDIMRILVRKTVSDPLGESLSKFAGDFFDGLFNANGNAFDASGVVPFANGGVVNRITPFMFANGGRLGVMGEAGPEAILPLSRGRNGKLGVQSEVTAAMPNINVNLIEAPGRGGEVKQQADAFGTITIDVMVEKITQKMGGQIQRGGGLAPVLESTYALNRGGR